MPDLLPWAETPWRAWNELNAERGYTLSGFAAPMGAMILKSRPLPIPWSSIQAWCDRAGCDPDDRTEFVVPLVQAMDREFLAHWAAQEAAPPSEPVAAKLSRWEQG